MVDDASIQGSQRFSASFVFSAETMSERVAPSHDRIVQEWAQRYQTRAGRAAGDFDAEEIDAFPAGELDGAKRDTSRPVGSGA